MTREGQKVSMVGGGEDRRTCFMKGTRKLGTRQQTGWETGFRTSSTKIVRESL